MQQHNGVKRERKIVFVCLPGLQAFLSDIVFSLQVEGGYDVRLCLSKDMKEISESIAWADIVWLEWANEVAIAVTRHQHLLNGKDVVCRLHSYEAFAGYALEIDWSKVNSLVFVAEHIRDFVFKQFAALGRQIPDFATYVVPNGVDLGRFELPKDKTGGFNLAFLGDINYKKGPMLLLHAFQRLHAADSRYHLHIAGNFQDARYALYFSQMLGELGIGENVHTYGRVPHDSVQEWLLDKQYILCTSVLEGHPVGLMEAMACGLKPIIHTFVGAKDLYPDEYLWSTVDEFVDMILHAPGEKMDSEQYRRYVAATYSLPRQMEQIRNVLEDLPAYDGDGVVASSDQARVEVSEEVEKGRWSGTIARERANEMPTSPVMKALAWVEANIVTNEKDVSGIAVSSKNRSVYPEVSGYLVPTLLSFGKKDLALRLADNLAYLQLENGSFPGPNGDQFWGDGFVFDTAQAVRGFLAALDDIPDLEKHLRKACDWIVKSTDAHGALHVPTHGSWSMGKRGGIPEAVLLYALPPMLDAAEKLGVPEYKVVAERALRYYLNGADSLSTPLSQSFDQPNMLSHFYFYIQDALLDMGEDTRVREAMEAFKQYQPAGHVIQAFSNVSWVCSPGQAQASVVLSKLGEKELAKKTFDFMTLLQNGSGGFFGSYGVTADYFPTEEISWAVKFYLDAAVLLGGGE